MSLNDNEKDFVDKFFDYFNIYKGSGVRFFAVAIMFFILFIIGFLCAPALIKISISKMPFKVDFLVLTPVDILFNYCKIALFFASFLTFPYFLYQFGKLRYENIDDEQKADRIIISLVFTLFIFLGMFLTSEFFFPAEIMFFYGMNFGVAAFSTSFSAIVSTFIYTDFILTMLIVLPYLFYLIKKSQFFSYAEMLQYKKPIMIYSGILTAIIALPVEILFLGFVFLTFFLWYKVLLNFAKKRDKNGV